MKRIAFYGGSFDPLHIGHLAIARRLSEIFRLDTFYFIPAFHAPHKKDKKVTSAFCRYAMLALATNNDDKIEISTVELDAPEKPFTVETQAKLLNHYGDSAEIFFVIGADSWNDIRTWRDWEKVLTQTNIIVVTRPDYEIIFDHVTEAIRENIVDLRMKSSLEQLETSNLKLETKIYLTDAVFIDVSATEIRQNIKEKKGDWRELVPEEVAKYVEKYNLYI